MTRLSLAIFLALSLAALAAQDRGPVQVEDVETSSLSDILEGRLKKLEDDSSLDEVIKQSLGDRYREALDSLQQAESFRASEAEYRQALEQGPGETLRIRSEIDAIKQKPEPEDALPQGLTEPFSNDDLESAIARERVALTTLNTELENLGSRLSELRTRPSQISERRIAAQSELTATLVQLESAEEAAASDPMSLGNRAEVDRLQALREKLSAEIAMLEQEDLSDEIRMATTEAARDLAELKIEASEKTTAALRELATTLLTDRVRQAEALVAEIHEQSPDASAEMLGLVEDLKLVISETHEVSGAIRVNEALSQQREAERKRITEAFNNAKRQSELGVLEGTLAKVIMEQIRTLPTQRNGKQRLAATRSETGKARRGIVELDRKIRAQAIETQARASDPEQFEAPINSIRETRDSLQEDLRSSYRRWIRELGELDLVERQVIADAQSFRDFASEKLFWVRSSPGIGWETFAALPEGIAYCYGIKRLGELGDRLAAIPPWFYLLAGGILAALLLPRRYFHQRLRGSGLKTKRISTDRYAHTLVAFLMTVLLAAPAAVVLALAGWSLMRQPDATEWSFSFGLALLTAASFLFLVSFLIVLCRKDGLGEVHFGWEPAGLLRCRRLAFWLIPIYLPVVITLILVVTEPSISYLNGLGRLTGLAAVISLGVIGVLIMDPEKGIAASAHRLVPENYFGRLRHVWFYLAVAVPVLLAVFFLVGFILTALLLIQQIEMSLTAIIVAFVLYGMILRWFAIRERKLALEEAVAERNARREAAAIAQEEETSGAEVAQTEFEGGIIPEIEEEEVMDLAEVGHQMRNLVSFLIGAGLLVVVLLIWTQFAPVLDVLDKVNAFGGFSIADLAITVLVIAVTISTTRNLPGLLELLILRRIDLDNGTRNSINTLAKYTVYAIGAMFLFRTLGVDWSKLGWVAAALSVGIGFGLQEVVANFISGIILLFERPVRVGDVVTVDGIDGVVSRIQIRATTVTNWDRKELIIPNKNFITGTVLNWTLSNAVNRIVVVVGVAYGTDTEKARQILVDVANDHPRVLDDPPSLATFEAFADSSLTLRLRCYVPDMDGRVVIITDLHTEIDKRFKEAGIEIAFPQQDLHLRSVDPGVQLSRPSGDSKD